ncbi:hypothetical protein BKA57DRAFT_456651 [Linnemannia elongata]|nr:hypothetical protein BKA57DRAFT_456651 [Linnemannia elongata]
MAGEERKQTNDNENQINKNTRKMARKKWRIEHPFIMRVCPCLIFYMLSRGSNCTLAWFLLFMFWLFWLPCLYTCVATGGTTNDSPARKEKKIYQQKLTNKGAAKSSAALLRDHHPPSFTPCRSPYVRFPPFFLAWLCFGLTPLNQVFMVCAFFLPKPEIEPKCPFISHGVYTQMYLEQRRSRPRKKKVKPILLHLHPPPPPMHEDLLCAQVKRVLLK